MGANPAELLYNQLQAWNTRGSRHQTAAQLRGIEADISMAIRRHTAALANLQSVGELLEEAEKLGLFPVDVYRNEIPEWGRMVLSLAHGWGHAAAFKPESLQLLGTLVSQVRPMMTRLPDGAADQFEAALDQVLEALRLDESVSEDVRKYLLNLVIHMKLVIEECRLGLRGDYDLGRAATLLKTTIDIAYEKTTDASAKKRWAALKKIFTVQNAVNTAIQWSVLWPTLMLSSGN